MAADEEIVGRVRGVQRLAVQHRIQLHELGALQIVQHDVQAIARVVVDAMPVGVDDGGRHRVVFVGIDGVVAFRQHHVEQIVLRGDVMVQRRLGDAQLVGDVLQRHAPEPLGGDDFDGGLQDLQVAFLLTHTLAFDEGLVAQRVPGGSGPRSVADA